ncbi:hypothetical protein ARMGADRAFT_186207 [Armillaria gallica]|uniref:Cullin N-terminal domain-containing protein n=1 Tax=Armillaria gallica TaxID=47427 RepID=A0A2H3D965_ARMGA|nr:hypothetical protein ARMGADRAFT_186207 [Armillaria gallica]
MSSSVTDSSTVTPSNSSSMHEKWTYLLPGINRVFQTAAAGQTVSYADIYLPCYTEIYRFLTSPPNDNPQTNRHHSALYMYTSLDHYFACMALEYRKSHTAKDVTVAEEIQHIISSSTGFSNGANMIDRLFTYLNRHWIKNNMAAESSDSESLSKWGYDLSTGEGRMKATWCARVANPSSIIPVYSLALRRFRTEFGEPLFNSGEFSKRVHDVVGGTVIQDEGTIRKLWEICSDISVEPSHPVPQKLGLFLKKSSEAKGQSVDMTMVEEVFQ